MLSLCRTIRPFLVAGMTVIVGACSSWSGGEEFTLGSVATPASADLRLANAQFQEGAYGNAEKHFKIAVEKEPKNPEAWLGLAASYDYLRRFDLADKAYGKVRHLAGDTPTVLNNIGYSHLLRGDLNRARYFLSTAYQGDPSDDRIISNIETLNEMLMKKGEHPLPT
ncbi:MAG: tetratricopeptide repeat protein [Hyphomicrobiaceae bacterium]